jgi:hypothetical protein
MSAIAAFLCTVWSYQPHGYGTVARKDYTAPAGDEWTFRRLHFDGRPLRVRGDSVHNLYFTPLLYAEPNHRSVNALGSRWLFADLDEADPRETSPVPTIAWETSTGRYQALWLLDRVVERQPFLELNQRLTYLVGADRGGWDGAQLLRLPGSVSTKHGQPFAVTLLWDDGPSYSYADVAALVRHVAVAEVAATAAAPIPDVLGTATDVLAQHGRNLRPMDLRTLHATAASADRSGTLWHLNQRLFAAGLTREEVFGLTRGSVWNKWPHSPQRLWRDVCRAYERYARARSLAGDGLLRSTRPTKRARDKTENGTSNG